LASLPSQYLSAGRNLSLPAFVATLVSTWYGGILGIGESVSYFGVGTWLLLGIPYYVFALIYAAFFATRVRAADQITIPERLDLKWGGSPSVIGAGLLFMLAVPAAHVLMLGVLVSSLTGWELAPAVIVATLVGTLFLYRGGLLADVRVSLLAFLMMYVGFAVIVGYCLLSFPPAETFSRIQPRELLSFTGGSGWIAIVSFFILGSWTLVDPGFHQRVAASKDPATGRRGVVLSVLFWLLFDLLSITAGLYALALLSPLPDNRLAIFPTIAEQALPSGLKGLFLCGMLGTIVSAMVGYALIAGASIGKDAIARIAKL
jgi:solute:Na+ symporter, SSS family